MALRENKKIYPNILSFERFKFVLTHFSIPEKVRKTLRRAG